MELLLTILSVLAVWALLGLLLLGLLVIAKSLGGVRTSLEKIAAGVRAIETEVRPLGPQAATLSGTLGHTARSLDVAGERLEEMGRTTGGAARS